MPDVTPEERQARALSILRSLSSEVPAIDTSEMERERDACLETEAALHRAIDQIGALSATAHSLPDEIANLEVEEAKTEALVELGREPRSKLDAIRFALAQKRTALADTTRKIRSYESAKEQLRAELANQKDSLPYARGRAVSALSTVMLARLREAWRATLELHHAYLMLEAFGGRDVDGSASTLARGGQGIFDSEGATGLAREIGLSGQRDFGLSGTDLTNLDPTEFFSLLRKE